MYIGLKFRMKIKTGADSGGASDEHKHIWNAIFKNKANASSGYTRSI